MQGSPPCEICTAVTRVAQALYKYCTGTCAPDTCMCMQISDQNRLCMRAQMLAGAGTQRHSALSSPSHSRALKIGLTGITLDILPIQLDYTSDSAFIRLCRKHRHVNAHTWTLTRIFF